VAPDYDYGYVPYAASGPMMNAPTNAAQIMVRVPVADAQVWFEGQRTTQDGTVRAFESPALNPGQKYIYDIRAEWNQNGQLVSQTRHINVQAGAMVSVDFTQHQTPAQVPTSASR
jgi:uncharacterized protein (TIGR03000 family)